MITTVVGIGNLLLGDDGAGVQLVRRLNAYRFEPEIALLDGGTLGLGLVHYLAETDRLLLIDAVRTGAAPGTVVVLRDRDVPAVLRATLSAHDASIGELLAALTLLGKMPRELVAIGIEAERTAPSLELSPAVHEALVAAERETLAHLARWGVAPAA